MWYTPNFLQQTCLKLVSSLSKNGVLPELLNLILCYTYAQHAVLSYNTKEQIWHHCCQHRVCFSESEPGDVNKISEVQQKKLLFYIYICS